MNPIKQAIEALLYVRDCSYIDDNGSTALMKIYDPEHVDAALAALRSMPAEPVPVDCDVRKILLKIVPGDGDGYEVYAKSVADVEAKLGDMGLRLEEWEMGIRRLATTHTAPLSDAEIDDIIKEHTGGFIGGTHLVSMCRAIERAVFGRGEKL